MKQFIFPPNFALKGLFLLVAMGLFWAYSEVGEAPESVSVGGVEYKIAKGSEVLLHENGSVRKATLRKNVKHAFGDETYLLGKGGFVEFSSDGGLFSGQLAPGQALVIDGNQYPFEGRLYFGGTNLIAQLPSAISVEQNDKTYAFRGILVVGSDGKLALGQLPEDQALDIHDLKFVKKGEFVGFSGVSPLVQGMRHRVLGSAAQDKDMWPGFILDVFSRLVLLFEPGSGSESALWLGDSTYQLHINEHTYDVNLMVALHLQEGLSVFLNPEQKLEVGGNTYEFKGKESIMEGMPEIPIQTSLFPNGGVKSGDLASDHTLNVGGSKLTFSGNVFFHENGRLASASLVEEQELSLDGEDYVVRGVVLFHDNGTPKSIRLRESTNIEVAFKAHAFEALYFTREGVLVGGLPEGKTASILEGEQAIKVADLSFDEGKNRFVQFRLSGEQGLSFDSGDGVVKKTYQKGEVLRLYKDGTLAGSGREWDWNWTGERK